MFAKTWRVHAIFKNVKMKKKVLENLGRMGGEDKPALLKSSLELWSLLRAGSQVQH